MQDVVIVAATRTAIGRFQGGLADVPATKLGEAVVRRLLADTGVEPGAVDEEGRGGEIGNEHAVGGRGSPLPADRVVRSGRLAYLTKRIAPG